MAPEVAIAARAGIGFVRKVGAILMSGAFDELTRATASLLVVIQSAVRAKGIRLTGYEGWMESTVVCGYTRFSTRRKVECVALPLLFNILDATETDIVFCVIGNTQERAENRGSISALKKRPAPENAITLLVA